MTSESPPPTLVHHPQRPPASTKTPFTLAMKGKMSEEKVKECHRAMTRFVAKGLHLFPTVKSPLFRCAKLQ